MKKSLALLLMSAGFLLQAQDKKQQAIFGDPNHFDLRVSIAEMTDPKLFETSGMAASVKNPGYIWVQNDSGNAPEVYLVDKNLKIVFTCKLKGVFNRDWEDMAVGPGPEAGKTYIYIADIGDNLGIFPTKVIYRFEEPKADTANPETEIRDLARIIFRLPGGITKDSESMLLDPNTKDLYILSKEDSARLYQVKYPYSSGNKKTDKQDTVTAIAAGVYNLPKATSGAISQQGDEILIKNYRRVWYWKNPEHKPIAEIISAKPIMIPYDLEPQGEAIAWLLDGSGFYTLSEKKKDKKSLLYFYKRK